MGATNFVVIHRDGASMLDSYRALVSQALWESGHSGYNGTISTTNGCIQDPKVTEPMTEDEALAHIENWWDRDEQPRKWDDAWAIPLKAEPDYVPDHSWEGKREQSGWLFYGWAAC